MSNVRFDELELMLMAMFEQPTLRDTMQQLNEQQFKGLELEWYKPDEPNKKTEVAEK